MLGTSLPHVLSERVSSLELKPIGHLSCLRRYHWEQPAQGVLSRSEGVIELNNGFNFEQALKDLEGFDYIWLIYLFHLNKSWKPLTNPPFNDGRGRKGVFATRSPYRPNPIGLSCVRLLEIKGRKLYVGASDLLDGTPILDIKPYIAEYDSFPEARRGWLEGVKKAVYNVRYQPKAQQKLDFLLARGVELCGIIEAQLGFNPFDKTRNKFVQTSEGLLMRFKSWRILFEEQPKEQPKSAENCEKTNEKTNEKTGKESLCINVLDVGSGYQSFDKALGNDTLEDLAIHQEFQKSFQ
jgi:tRNA-Thr(GGU) m(6)t(6)A37 methyltransferase TsaA